MGRGTPASKGPSLSLRQSEAVAADVSGRGAESIGRELVEACAECGAAAVGAVDKAVAEHRVAWAVSTRCSGCGIATESNGLGEVPATLRTALVARVGLVRLRADPDTSRSPRRCLLNEFRRQGASISEAVSAFDMLTSSGIIGTPAEMRLLARQLTQRARSHRWSHTPPASERWSTTPHAGRGISGRRGTAWATQSVTTLQARDQLTEELRTSAQPSQLSAPTVGPVARTAGAGFTDRSGRYGGQSTIRR